MKYVGLTKNARRREWMHCSLSNNTGSRRINIWLRHVLGQGKKPVFEILEETDDLVERERYWISQFDGLLNMTEGGQGNPASFTALRGKPMARVHFLKKQMRHGIAFAKSQGNVGLEAVCRFALEVANA